MAGFLELIDNTLGTHFDTPVYKPAEGQKKFVKQIELAKRQFQAGTTNAPKRQWAVGNNKSVRYSPKIDGHPVLIGGVESNHVPHERFEDFLDGLKAEVEKGALDKEIKAALDGDEVPAASKSSSTGTRGSRSPLSNIRSSIGRSLSNGKSLAEAEATVRAKGVYDAALIDQVIAEEKAKAKAK
jgi:hypothetical protein